MRLETIRITADWLKHATKGINSYIPAVPRDAGDPQPPLVASWTPEGGPATLAIFDETRHLWVADRKDPPALPAIFVTSEGGLDLEGEPTPDGQIRATTSPVVVVARYLTGKADTVAAIRDGEYTLRALLRSLWELMKNENVASRTRNSICVVEMTDPATYLPVVESVGESRVTGAIGINYTARDAAPSF